MRRYGDTHANHVGERVGRYPRGLINIHEEQTRTTISLADVVTAPGITAAKGLGTIMGLPTKYDILGNIITYPVTTTTVNYTTVTTKAPTTSAPTTTTTTPVPAIEQDPELTHLDVFLRYPSLNDLLQRFAPESIEIDKFVTPCWLPISCLSLVICSVVFANWQRVRGGRNAYKRGEPLCLTSLRAKNSQKPGRPSFMASGQFMCYCLLYLFYCVLVALHDLDGAWNTSVLTWIRAACPITHGLKMTAQISIALTTLLIGLRGLLTTRSATSMPLRRPLCCRRIRDLRKCIFGRLRSALLITIISTTAGMMNVLFWEVAIDKTASGSLEAALPRAGGGGDGEHSSPLRLKCGVVGGYPNLFRLQFMTGLSNEWTGRDRPDAGLTYAIYLWSLNLTIFLPIALASLVLAFLLRRRWLKRAEEGLLRQMADPIYQETEKRRPARLEDPAREEDDQLKLSCAVCVLYGLFSLPIVLLFMLLPVSVPGVNELPDKEILEDPTWQRFFQYAIAVSAACEIRDLTSALLLLVCVAASVGFRRRCASLLALRSSCSTRERNTLAQKFSRVDRRRRRLQDRVLASLRRGLTDIRGFPACLGRRSPSRLTSHSLFSPAEQPTWRWGKGWRFPSTATSSPPPVWSPIASPGASERTVLSPRLDMDPDLLDALVQQHNAYATERGTRTELEPLSATRGHTLSSPIFSPLLPVEAATSPQSPPLATPAVIKQSSGRRYIKNPRT
ncbi:unnamed protein product [Schistocephalus solidus]|uniref:G_PROTEIN_RECEP_F1_2 domain-containing protein n=1 Tax=Schistocephalus solidus TaxID=70667 RepID=A0A183SP98_SCHSO|nr:unnamed protein product [Schistocephalus solidus]